MARGPLPQPESRRRNAPTIPTTALPAAGRAGPAPRVPSNVALSKHGKAWWKWAWSTPQAAAWDDGSVQIVARRAALEDDLATIGEVESVDFDHMLDVAVEPGASAQLRLIVRALAALATGRLAIIKEMRETDRLLGLTPKSLAELRWKITEAEPDLTVVAPPTPIRKDDAPDPRKLLA